MSTETYVNTCFIVKINVCYAFPDIYTIKTVDVTDGSCEIADVLTSLPVTHAILPRAMCFAASRPANHAI